MSENENNDDNKNENQPVDFDALSKKITDGLREEIDTKLNDNYSKLDKKLDSLKPDPSPEDDDDLDDELVVSKKDLKEMVAKELKGVTGSIKDTISESLSESSRKSQLDEKAFSDFPMLNNKTSAFSQEFASEVTKEMKQRVSDGDNTENPRLVYDAAASVYARSSKYQQLKRDFVENYNRQQNNREASFEFSTKTTPQQTTASDAQLNLAKKLGLDPEKVKEHFKNKK